MQGEIDAIRDTILDFVAEIERDGVRVRVGLLAFGDRFNGEESFVFRFDGETFTKDAAIFRREVSRLRAGGGGDIPESSMDALLLAVRQPFALDASRVIVLVTDAPPHIPDKEAQNMGQVAMAIQSAGIKQLYLVIRTQDPTSGVYLSLLEGTQGLAFELGSGDDFRTRAENFKKTLRALGRTISTGTR
jgi:Mg-chelatase subunit ChlD